MLSMQSTGLAWRTSMTWWLRGLSFKLPWCSKCPYWLQPLWVQPGSKKPLFKHKHSLKRKIPGHQHLNGDDLLYHIHRLETREVEWGIEGGGAIEHWAKRWKERKLLEKRRVGWEQMPVLIRVNSVVELWWSQIFLKLPNPKPTERGAGPHAITSGVKAKQLL